MKNISGCAGPLFRELCRGDLLFMVTVEHCAYIGNLCVCVCTLTIFICFHIYPLPFGAAFQLSSAALIRHI